MSFRPLRLLLVWDPAQGLCERIVPGLTRQLEDRAFLVEARALEGPADAGLSAFAGLVLGCPVPGAGLRRHGPSGLVEAWLQAQTELDQVKTALFTVGRLGAGHTLRNTRQRVHDLGGEVVVAHHYCILRPGPESYVLAAECMVRIR